MNWKFPVILAVSALLLSVVLFALFPPSVIGNRRARPGFAGARGTQFVVDGKPLRFVGANVAVMYRDEDRTQMPETLRVAAENGVKVIRVWAFGEGGGDSRVKAVGGDSGDWPRTHPFRRAPDEWNEEAFVHLDKVIAEARKNGIFVQLCLTNWWRDTGGVTQYLQWAGVADAADNTQPFGINVERAMEFYSNERTRQMYRAHVARIVGRRNTITGELYKDDPTIMAYELMNEAQAPTGRRPERRAWVAEMSAYIKSLDPDHLVTPGVWGYRNAFERREWLLEHALPSVDFIDVHNYPRDDLDSFVDSPQAFKEFIDNRAAAAYSLKKPLVFGEFGMGPEGYKNVSEAGWYRAFFTHSLNAGAAGAMFWILTPDPGRGYGITYMTKRDAEVRAVIRQAADEFAAQSNAGIPSELRATEQHLIPRQFAFTRDAATMLKPEFITQPDGTLLYRFAPEAARAGRFERLGGDAGYIWGLGMGEFEFVVPPREGVRRVGKIIVRAHLQPVLPHDGNGRIRRTRVTLLINAKDCGSRLIDFERPEQTIISEWQIDALSVRLVAARGTALALRFVVTPDADLPFGINISNFKENYALENKDARPVEVEIR